MSAQATGQRGEDLAAEHLEAKGFTILDRNYRFERGELDLVAFLPSEQYDLGGELVFVEVKTRRGTGYGRAEETVTDAQKRTIMRTAEAYLHERRLEGSPARYDVVAIHLAPDGSPEIEHFEHAFGMFF